MKKQIVIQVVLGALTLALSCLPVQRALAAEPGLPIRTESLDISPQRVATPDTVRQENYGYPSVKLAPRPDGGSYLGWTDSEWNAHITPLDARDQRAGVDIVIPQRGLLALIAREDGFAVLLSEPVLYENKTTMQMMSLYLAQYRADGSRDFETTLIADSDIRDEKGTILDSWGNVELVWSGQHYAANCPTSHNWGTRAAPDIHQGDALFIVDGAGKLLEPSWVDQSMAEQTLGYSVGGWRWNVSHSFEQRLVSNGRFFAMLAKGDAYPRGLTLNYQADPSARAADALGLKSGSQNLLPMKGEIGLNYVPLALGDMVLLGDGPLISFTTSEDRPTYDVGLMKVNWAGEIQFIKWLTKSDQYQENSVKMARYGQNILIGWSRFVHPGDRPNGESGSYDCCESSVLGVLDPQGEWLQPPAVVDLLFAYNWVIHENKQIHVYHQDRFDRFTGGHFVSFPGGEAGWAESIGNPGQILIHRVLNPDQQSVLEDQSWDLQQYQVPVQENFPPKD